MTVKEVLALAAEHLGRADLNKQLEELSEGAVPTGEIASLLRCYDLVENELAVDHLPLRAEEELSAAEHFIAWDAFAYAPAGVRSVFFRGRETVFEPQKEGLFLPAVDCGRVRVRYCYSPAPKSIDGKSEFGGRVSARLLSFGVAREFCLSRGMFEEAKLWDGRYRDAVRAAGLPRRALAMRARRWV